jgi:hypothetical protein
MTKDAANRTEGYNLNRLAFVQLIRELEYAPTGLTRNELVERTGLVRQTVEAYLTLMHQPEVPANIRKNVVYIYEYVKRHHFYTPKFKLGSSPDAKKPARKSNAQAAREYRAKVAKAKDEAKAHLFKPRIRPTKETENGLPNSLW